MDLLLAVFVTEETALLVGSEVGGGLELALGVQWIVAAGELAKDGGGRRVGRDLVLVASILAVDEAGTGELAVRLGALARW